MGLTVAPLEAADIPQFVRIELEAFRPHPRIRMLWPAGYTDDLYAYYEACKRKDFADSSSRFVKAVDDENGQMIAVGQWTFGLDPKILDDEANVDPLGQPPPNWPFRGNWEIRRFFSVNTQHWRRKYLTGKRYIQLDILVTHPDAHRRGAGSKLLAWGIEQADKEGIMMCLEATPTGLALYKRHGFREVETIKADMKQFGWNEPYEEESAKRVWMIREPNVTA